jgi:hypothetical protein
LTATPVQAAGPLDPSGPIKEPTFVLPEPVPFGPCPTVGSITDSTVDRTTMSWSRDGGHLVRSTAQVAFTGTLTGAGGEVPYVGHFRVTDDYDEGVSITTGLNGRAVLPDGEVVVAAGRRVVDLDTGTVEMVAGANTFADFTAEVCAALAG